MNSGRRDDRLAWWRDPSPLVTHTAWVRFFAQPVIRGKSRMPSLVSLVLLLFGLTHAMAQDVSSISSIEGTWTLAFADVLHPDGTRDSDYGTKPKGMMHIDSAGRYAIFIFDGSRPRFGSADKKTGTDSEIRAAFLGTSSHYGTVTVDPAARTLDFHIEGSTYPNWEGTTQRRRFEIDGNTLSYRVPPRPNGDVPLTGWKRVSSTTEKP
jgi:hypothetical protein